MVRAIACPVTFPALVESALAEIGRYGASSVSVTCRLLEAIRNVAACVADQRDRQALLEQTAAIVERMPQISMASRDRHRVEQCCAAAQAAVGNAAGHGLPTECPGRRPG
jgi:uncharacterized membrane protein